MHEDLHHSQVAEFQHCSFCRKKYQELDKEKESKFYSHYSCEKDVELICLKSLN
jgi:hypothetical protein